MSRREGQRKEAYIYVKERGRESQAASTLSAEPNIGLDPKTLGSWSEPKTRVGCSA